MALSLVLKVFIAGLHVPLAVAGALPDSGATGASAQTPSIAQVIICTPTGVKTFTLDENGDPVEVPTTPQVLTDCGVCSVLQTGLAALSPEPTTYGLEGSSSEALSRAQDAQCTPSAPRLARGHDPPRV